MGGVADGFLDAIGIDIDFGNGCRRMFQMLTIQGILSL